MCSKNFILPDILWNRTKLFTMSNQIRCLLCLVCYCIANDWQNYQLLNVWNPIGMSQRVCNMYHNFNKKFGVWRMEGFLDLTLYVLFLDDLTLKIAFREGPRIKMCDRNYNKITKWSDLSTFWCVLWGGGGGRHSNGRHIKQCLKT